MSHRPVYHPDFPGQALSRSDLAFELAGDPMGGHRYPRGRCKNGGLRNHETRLCGNEHCSDCRPDPARRAAALERAGRAHHRNLDKTGTVLDVRWSDPVHLEYRVVRDTDKHVEWWPDHLITTTPAAATDEAEAA